MSVKETLYCVLHKHCNGHWAYASGNGGDVACYLACTFKIYVSHKLVYGFSVRAGNAYPVDTHVNYNGAGLDHICGDHLGAAYGCYKDVRLRGYLCKVLCA